MDIKVDLERGKSPSANRGIIIRLASWFLLAAALFQFIRVALPPGNADLISIQSLALDIANNDPSLLYPGKDFARNPEWVAHHEANLKKLGGSGEPNWCFYPPLIPFLLAPLASAGADTWRVVWGAIQLILAACFAVLIARLLSQNKGGNRPRYVLIFALVFGAYPLARSVELGQTSLAIAVLLWWGIYIGASRTILRGASVGASSLIKPFLLAVEGPDVLRRNWRPAITTLVVWLALIFLSIVTVGWSANREYWNFLTTLGGSQTAYCGNQSLLAGLLRIFSNLPVTDYGFLQDSKLMVLGRLLGLSVLGVAVWAQYRSNENPILSAGMWISAALLALPISWEHHLVLLLPVVALLWTRSWSVSGWLAVGTSTALICIDSVPLYGEQGMGRVMACLPLFGNLILFVILIVLHRRSHYLPVSAG